MRYSTDGGPTPGESRGATGPDRMAEGDRRCEIPVFGTSPYFRGSHKQEKVIVVIDPCTEELHHLWQTYG
jgi:hypothetical protein